MAKTKKTIHGIATLNERGDIHSLKTLSGITLTVGDTVVSNGRTFASSGLEGILKMILEKDKPTIYEVNWGVHGTCDMEIKDFDLKAMEKIS